MRVLHVIPSLAANQGGPTLAVRMMQRALARAGVRADIASTDDDGHGGHAPASPPGEASPGAGSVLDGFRRNTRFYKFSLPLLRWLLGNVGRYDVVHVHALFSFSSVAAAAAAWWRGVPYVLRPLGTLAAYGMGARRPWLKRLSFRAIEAPILRRAAAVHFTSELEQAEALALPAAMRGVVIPLAVEASAAGDPDLLFARFPSLRGKRCVLFLSRLDPKKNLEGVLGAAARCMQSMPEARWLIAGDGAPGYVAGLRERASALGLDGHVFWAGRVEGEEKAAAFAASCLFVLPSHSENFGIAAAEALAAGLPVVLGGGVALAASAAAAGAGVLTDTTPEAIAEAVEGYLGDEPGRAASAARAREFAAREFSTATMAARLLELYRRIEAQPRARRTVDA